MHVTVTQFILPRGTREFFTIEFPDDLQPQWDAIQKAGLRLTAEILTTGDVSLCIEDPKRGDFDVELAQNKPGPREPVKMLEELIRRFTAEKYEKWKEQYGD